ncbi:PaaI family thioesterase [Marinobacter bryozoorum]|jgi:acyl-CoA thioesterase|uniref:PaaI family thioesterase n=1 Tax=Marinobacter bryozoorum TaxID=256324 RepID=UPI002004D3BF|nr:PaaI family thioesterase [Marinobacter bryozoorum]MCK7544603.1 PaaI family thioesterase [Marinobacter bryozoorum]
MKHPFPDLIDMVMDESEPGWSVNSIQIGEKHKNTNNVAHGAVLYALADTGMGSALFPTLDEGQVCATIEIKMTYFKPVFAGRVVCRTEMVNRGKTIANLESRLYVDDVLVAQANGNYAIFRIKASNGNPGPSKNESDG